MMEFNTDHLREREWLTPAEYAVLLSEDLYWGEEHHAETVAQYRSECALFGDAGPGQGIACIESSKMLRDLRDRLEHVRRVIANLEGA
jgi:hypothetical protein